MQKFDDTESIASQVTGLPISGAMVIVQNYPSGTPAIIYAVNDKTSTPIVGSALTTNAKGQCPFYAPDGRYQLAITPVGGTQYISTDILFDDPADDAANLASTFAPLSEVSRATTAEGVLTANLASLDGGVVSL